MKSRQSDSKTMPATRSCVSRWLLILVFLTSATVQVTATPTYAREADTAQVSTIHVVVAGDSLSQIAVDYGVTVEQIVAANGLLNEDLISIGQQLRIPVAAATAPAASAPDGRSEGQQYLACPANTDVYALDLPAEPIRLTAQRDDIYMIAGGDLFRLPLANLDQFTTIVPTNLTPPDRRIGDYFIRELVYLAQDDITDDLLLLDKTNDVYRFTEDGEWQMESLASPVPGQYPDPQFLAVQSVEGDIYALDADLRHIWQLTENVPRNFLSNSSLDGDVDMAVRSTDVGPQFFVLGQDGTITQHQPGYRGIVVDEGFSLEENWPSQVLIHDDTLYAVDGEERGVRRLDLGDDADPEAFAFRLPGMSRLRSIDILGQKLYALAGKELYVVDLSRSDSVECPVVPMNDTYTFYDQDMLEAMGNVRLPFDGAVLTIRPRSFPGARRLYRYGVHRGLDIYGLEAPGLGVGSPTLAIADGIVVQANRAYTATTPSEFTALLSRARAEHRTPPDLMERFHGRQVRIDHGNNIESWYSHLGSIAPDLSVGESITQGETVGTVGVSGTSSEAYGTNAGVHLHLEIWVDGNYLGHGLSLYETMRLWQALFSEPRDIVTPVDAPAESLPNGSTPAPKGY